MFMGAEMWKNNNKVIYSVVASIDSDYNTYGLCLIDEFDEKSMDSKNAYFNLLKNYQNYNNDLLPERIIYYCNVINEGDFEKIAKYDVSKLKEACQEIDKGYSPKITFVLVQKYHNTRFFPINSKDMTLNKRCISGLVVDTDICDINQFNFYLCSFSSTSGANVPTHYWVFHDENSFDSDDIQNLTYMICHSYNKEEIISSIPIPAYYAHIANLNSEEYLRNNIVIDISNKNLIVEKNKGNY